MKPSFKIAKHPHSLTIHGEAIVDNYHWLRDYDWPEVKKTEVLDYLNAENQYCDRIMTPLKSQEDKIYNELLGRIKLADQSVPNREDSYYYYTRTTENSNYPIYCRRKEQMYNPEEVILNVNELAENFSYFNLGSLSVNPSHDLLAYSTDTTGGERYNIFVKNLITNEIVESEVITGTLGSIIWHQARMGFFYTPVTEDWRAREVFYHAFGTKASEDICIFKEENEEFHVGINLSQDKKYLVVSSSSKTTSEVLILGMASSDLQLKVFLKRNEGHLYDLDHSNGFFYIRTNDKGRNFRLVKVIDNNPYYENWQELIPVSDKRYLTDFTLLHSFFAVEIKEDGLNKIEVFNYELSKKETINFPDPAYSASLLYTPYKADSLRISYSSLVSPASVMDYDFEANMLNTLKITEIPSGYNKELYNSERIMAPSEDGKLVPISLFYRKDLFKKDGSNPVFLYGYGSYGHAIPASFRSSALSLVDRGFVYAIAHVRGGDDLGFAWYEDAKFLTKKRTFEDFISCAEHLCSAQYTSEGNIAIMGGSAGGMLMGVVINEAPHLFKAALALVPFVDVLNTMLDETLPLTPGEFKEWGNPKDKAFFDYMRSYSPYDNVKAQEYPALYVTAGLTDPRVTYWEPAKWVAKLREMKTDKNLLLFKTYMKAGHAGAPGRFGHLRDAAEEYNFIFKIFGIEV